MKKKLTLLGIIFICLFTQKTIAQAFDGIGDTKLFLGYATFGNLSGLEFQTDTGYGNLVSLGSKLTFLLSNTTRTIDGIDYPGNGLTKFDAGVFLRFHLSEALKLSSKIDPYFGGDCSLKSLGVHAGMKYSISDTFSFYGQFSNSFSGSIMGVTSPNNSPDSYINYFAKKTSFSVGVTIIL